MTIVRYSPKLAEAASHGQPIVDYCRDCVGFDDYKALAAEVLDMERIETHDVQPGAPTVTADGVFFAVEAPGARRVQLVGDFNAWSLDASEMTQMGCVWTRVLKLEPGRYQYRYVIDGAWRSDPLNTDVEPSPYGGHNSVVVYAGRALP